ncbi:hypothetical protein AYO42_01740 [Rhizomicrobium sp. SCGC AG-212-E05]|nr:hypothetical protein AYO42_01740 [Rhizomicrobium sp. SCGC AG-212-E05]
MKVFWALGILVLASGTCGAAAAAPSDYSDIVVVSVVPRSPSVEPIIMSVPAKDRPRQAASLKPGASDARR